MKFLLLISCVIGLTIATAHHVPGHKEDDHHEHKVDDHNHDKKDEVHKEHVTGDAHEEHKKEGEFKAGELKSMEEDGIVPDVIKKLPAKPLSITFGKHEVKFGNELTPTQVKDEPKITWEAEKDAYYTLSMVDPDAPSRKTPTFREVNHWLMVNIPGNDLSKGETITAFLSSGPPKDTGLHRYVFLLYKQAKKLAVDEPKTPPFSREHRLNFSIAKFVEKYHLGDAVAGNFYKAQWDTYVDERNKKIKS